MPSVTSICGFCAYGVPTNTMPRWINGTSAVRMVRLERSIDELEAEEGNPRHFLAVRPRVRSTARHDGEEDSQCCLHGGGLRLGVALAKLGCRLAINAEIVTLLPANHCGIEDGLERPPR